MTDNIDKFLQAVSRGAHTVPRPSRKQPQQHPHEPGASVRCVPLGGLDEVGKNMMFFEHGRDIVVVDMGFQFPEEEMLGVDYVIPDVSCLEQKRQNIRGIIITHGHLDHIGAIPYLLPKLGNPPIFATKLTVGLIEKRLEEFGLLKTARLHTITADDHLRLGCFGVNFFRVNHSIPDSVGVILHTPAGILVHTGDFKFDFSSADRSIADFPKLAALGRQNVLALFSDSTNALEPGHTPSEQEVANTLEVLVCEARGRILIASFSSLIGRMSQILEFAKKYDKKVYTVGRSMVDNIEIARQLGYIKVPPHFIHPVRSGRKRHGPAPASEHNSLVLLTGSQGEPVSALTRISLGEHPDLKIRPGDTVILSSSPIPGNERAIFAVINNLHRLGAHVIFNDIADVHTSGHARQEDLKLMINLVRPHYLVPVHGELYMRMAHRNIGVSAGVSPDCIPIIENGDILLASHGRVVKLKERVSANYIFVEGPGMGDEDTHVLSERQTMAESGILIVGFKARKKDFQLLADPEIVSKGFIYMKGLEKILGDIRARAKNAYLEATQNTKRPERQHIKQYVYGSLRRFVDKKLKKQPLIVPFVFTVEK